MEISVKYLSKKRANGEKKIKGGRGCTNTWINISWPFLELSKAGQRSEVFLGFFALFVFFLTLHSLLNVFITTCIASIISSIFQNILIYEIFQFFIVPKVACKPIELPFESESSKTKIKHYTKNFHFKCLLRPSPDPHYYLRWLWIDYLHDWLINRATHHMEYLK